MGVVEVTRNPEEYEKTREAVDKHLVDVLQPMIDKMKPGTNELILDHGCGSGGSLNKFLLPLAQKTNSIIYALDNCKSMIEYGEKNFPNARVKYVHGNLLHTPSPLKDLKFNKIFSLFTLHHIHDYKGELKALSDLLAANEELCLIIATRIHIFDLYRQVKEHKQFKDHAKDHLVVPQWLDQDKTPLEILKEDLLNLGLEIEEISEDERTYNYKNPHTFADMFFALNGFAKSIHPDHHDELKNTYRKIHLEIETKTHKPHADAANNEYKLHYHTLHALVKKP